MDTIGVGLIGCGTVGQGVVSLMLERRDRLSRKVAAGIELRHVIDKDLRARRDVDIPKGMLSDDLACLLKDDQTRIAIELVGGTTVAKDIVLQCLEAGKDVVTANKALLAHHGRELYAAARRAGRCIAFEASCGGGIPLVESIRRGLIANEVQALYGIVNGTCNYILTQMVAGGKTYASALADAKAKGYAEADETLDVSGADSAHKLAILAGIAFGIDVDFDRITVEGIQAIDLTDLKAGQELGYVCKLLAIGQRRKNNTFSLRVHPAFIRRSHPLANVNRSFNAVSVYGDAVGHTLFYGRGAGRMPTASAVVADVVDVAIGNAGRTFEQLRLLNDVCEPVAYMPIEDVEKRYYFRLMVPDRPGVFARIAHVFGAHDISLSAINQHEPEASAESESVPVVVTTHVAREGNVRQALAEVSSLGVVTCPPVCIRVVEEHEEF
ncbi:MAG: homoserine dehydrogenase [Phycisphaerae bacterium]|nr:homoserine dehydrogenase [Phycisphaerae bacterium]